MFKSGLVRKNKGCGHPRIVIGFVRKRYGDCGTMEHVSPKNTLDIRPAQSRVSTVKIVHNGVPYTIDCYHDLAQVPTCAAKFYILLERHHADIKRLYEAWRTLCDKEMHVMSGGGLQLQAFFSTPGRYEGILYLSLIDDGRFQEIEQLLGEHGVPFTPYKPDPELIKGPHALVLEKSEWARKLPLVENIEVRCWDKSIKHTPPEIPLAPARTPNPYGDPLP